MSDKNFKTIRKQLINVVKALLPEVLSHEYIEAQHKKLAEQVEKRLEGLAAHMKFTLDKIDERTKEIQMYSVRNSIAPVTVTEQATPPTEQPTNQG